MTMVIAAKLMWRVMALAILASPVWADDFPVARCVNLDQALEAPHEGEWGYTITRPDIKWIAAQGFDTIRLPVRFDAHWNGQIVPGFLARVDAVIGWALAADLNVILDLHHFDDLMQDPSAHAATFQAIWVELAMHYADHDDRLIFELLNEPHDALSTSKAVALFKGVMPIIRAQNPDRWVIIEGGNWANIGEMGNLPRFDDRTALSFHYYGPWEFTHQQAGWLTDPLPPRAWGSEADIAAVNGDIAQAAEYGVPMLLGEFGVTVQTQDQDRADWTKAVRQAAENHDIGWCHWGFAGNFAIFDKDARDWMPGMQDALIADP